MSSSTSASRPAVQLHFGDYEYFKSEFSHTEHFSDWEKYHEQDFHIRDAKFFWATINSTAPENTNVEVSEDQKAHVLLFTSLVAPKWSFPDGPHALSGFWPIGPNPNVGDSYNLIVPLDKEFVYTRDYSGYYGRPSNARSIVDNLTDRLGTSDVRGPESPMLGFEKSLVDAFRDAMKKSSIDILEALHSHAHTTTPQRYGPWVDEFLTAERKAKDTETGESEAVQEAISKTLSDASVSDLLKELASRCVPM